jgi:hypothetical protein
VRRLWRAILKAVGVKRVRRMALKGEGMEKLWGGNIETAGHQEAPISRPPGIEKLLY